MIKLSDSEWKIIELLWNNGPMTITGLTRELKDTSGWSKSTVITLLKRMEEKKSIYHIEGEKAKMFYPAVERSEASMNETRSFLDKVYSGRIGLMISNMIKEEALTEEDFEELSKILKEGE